MCDGEGLGPKRVEGRVMEKVNPFMDKAGVFSLSISNLMILKHQMILMKLVT